MAGQPERDAAEPAPTRDRILDALVEVIVAGGLPEFSVQQIADRAGVAHRTVYRHFPTREALLTGLNEAVLGRMEARGSVAVPQSARDLPHAAAVNFGLFSSDRTAVEAGVRFSVGAAIEPPGRSERTALFGASVTAAFPGLSPEDEAMITAVLRQIPSSRSWLGIVVEGGLDEHAATRAVVWAVTVLLDAVRDGRVPSAEPIAGVDDERSDR